MEPRYKHDCKKCIPLGTFQEYDLYYCTQGVNLPTLIARYGEDWEYLTSPLTYKHCTYMISEWTAVALGKALEKGLIRFEVEQDGGGNLENVKVVPV